MAGAIKVGPNQWWSVSGRLFRWTLESIASECYLQSTKEALWETVATGIGSLNLCELERNSPKQLTEAEAADIRRATRERLPRESAEGLQPISELVEMLGPAD